MRGWSCVSCCSQLGRELRSDCRRRDPSAPAKSSRALPPQPRTPSSGPQPSRSAYHNSGKQHRSLRLFCQDQIRPRVGSVTWGDVNACEDLSLAQPSACRTRRQLRAPRKPESNVLDD
eukprot:955586-Rhodomonas_salina.3